MLELYNIKKTYKVGDIETRALDGVTVSFRENEFVAILGTSGSGKTTLLNIIGGLDRYDSGTMKIKGKDTSSFHDSDWDAYRNNSVGFVFQSYNLITHLSIVANVEMGMTLSGVGAKEKHARAIEVLERVGLKDHLHKKPNQLSGGQMQRVAIARALANNPEILLCDEPTGALDSTTSEQIMDLIKELSRERLIIMVTHNAAVAEKYADRIISLADGKIVSDTRPDTNGAETREFVLKKTSMSFLTALNLSFRNLLTKKGRASLTSFASSIGIIGIALILSVSTGLQEQIDIFQSDVLTQSPIFISKMTAEYNAEEVGKIIEAEEAYEEYPDTDEVYIYDKSKNTVTVTNKFSDEFLQYIEDIPAEICSSVSYTRIASMNVLGKNSGDEVIRITFPTGYSGSMSSFSGMTGVGLATYPTSIDANSEGYLKGNYDILYGEYPSAVTDVVFVVDNKNRIDKSTLAALGFDAEGESVKFTDIVGKEYKLVSNDDYYVKTPVGGYLPGMDLGTMYDAEDSITLRICGIVRLKEDIRLGLLGNTLAYSDELCRLVIERAQKSDIVKAQTEADYNVLTMEDIDDGTREYLLNMFGATSTPYMILIFPENFENKDATLAYLDDYNKGKADEDKIIYNDLAQTISDMTSSIIDGITIALIAFAGISLVVSLIMITIITYTSVLERTKEIGILRALGARKKDIVRVFNAETAILGLYSGVIGIGIAYILTIPINMIFKHFTEIETISQLNPLHALTLIIVSTLLTILGGLIPAFMASKRDAVIALRTE